MINFKPFTGVVTFVDEFFTGNNQENGCYKIVTIQNNQNNIAKFVITPDTYFLENFLMTIGETVTAYYDANAPVPLIYPPQYRALIVTKVYLNRQIKVDFFNEQLISSDGTLKLNLSPYTFIILENGQLYTGQLFNRNLIVIYNVATEGVPAITTPIQITVMCRLNKNG